MRNTGEGDEQNYNIITFKDNNLYVFWFNFNLLGLTVALDHTQFHKSI